MENNDSVRYVKVPICNIKLSWQICSSIPQLSETPDVSVQTCDPAPPGRQRESVGEDEDEHEGA